MSLETVVSTDLLRFFFTSGSADNFSVGVNFKQVTAQVGVRVPIIKISTTGGANELGLYIDTDGTSVRLMQPWTGGGVGPVIATVANNTWYQFALVGSDNAGNLRLTGYVGSASGSYDFTALNPGRLLDTLHLGSDYYEVAKGRFSHLWGQTGSANAGTVAAYMASSTPWSIVPSGSFLMGGSLAGGSVAAILGTVTTGAWIASFGMNPGTGVASADDYTYSGSGLSLTGGGQFPTTPIVVGIAAVPNTLQFTVGDGPTQITVNDSNGNPLPAAYGVATVAPFGGVTTDGSTDANGQFYVYPGAQAGGFTVVITYTDMFRGALSTQVQVQVLSATPPTIVAPVWVTTALPNAAAGAAYLATLSASQTSAYSKTSGPAWLTVDQVTGVATGTAPLIAGANAFVFAAANSAGSTPKSLNIEVVASPFVSGSLPAGTVGQPYSQSLANAAAAFSAGAGLSPSGLALGANGTVAGTPSGNGTFTFTVTAVYPDGTTFSQQFSITINAVGAGGTVDDSPLGRIIPRPRKRLLTATEFALALSMLMPQGRAWPRDPGTVQQRLIAAIGALYEQLQNRADYLLTDSHPAFTLELLPEWESTLGLPDPCAGESPTLQQRRRLVLARASGIGGASAAYFIAFAADLGYTITVESFAPFRVGLNSCADPIRGKAWAYAWSITAPTFSTQVFRVGQSGCNEPLRSWQNTVLECAFEDIKPANSHLLFRYS